MGNFVGQVRLGLISAAILLLASEARASEPKDPDDCRNGGLIACRLVEATREVIEEKGLRSAIVRVSRGGRPLITEAFGRSMTGVPARTDMHFRIGAVAIAYLGSIALQLQDRGILDLDEPIAKWLPNMPNANRVTSRMLLNGTSGYRDYVPMPEFQEDFYRNPFRKFSQRQLLDYAFSKPPLFAPGTDWNYSHTNYVVLGMVLQRAAGQPTSALMRQHIIKPMRLLETTNPPTPSITSPVLHAFTRERGTYEESTFWNPSWTLASGAIMTSDIIDMERSARLIGTGALLSRAAYREMLEPTTSGMGRWNRRRYFGLGVVVINGWILQTPLFHGYAGVMAYLPARDISVAIVSTKAPRAEVDGNFSMAIFGEYTKILSPGNVVE